MNFKNWLRKRQTQYGAYLSVYVLIVLAILSAANYLANLYNKTYDATSTKLFSLSDQTKKVVGNLKAPVKIYYFDDSKRFNESSFGPSPRDLLARYKNLSSKVSVEYIDPRRSPKLAIEMKISTNGTAIVEANGRREEAKSLGEEQVTNALIRALKPNKRMACFLTGHGENDLENSAGDGFSGVKEALEGSNFVTKPVSLLEKTPTVPGDCTVLVIPGPRNDLIEVEIEAIRKFGQGGGRIFFLLNPPTKNVNTTALAKLLGDWNVNVNNDIVVDLSGIGQFFGTDELSPLVTKYEAHAITSEMRNVASLFPFARSLDAGSGKPGVTVEKLFNTSQKSYGVSDFSSGEIKLNPKKDKPGPLCLSVAGTITATGGGEGVGSGRFVVSGSSRFVTNSALGFPGGNRDLFLNMMNWLSSDEDLISIRPKEVEDRRLTLSNAQMTRILYTNVFGLPALILIVGAAVWWKRR